MVESFHKIGSDILPNVGPIIDTSSPVHINISMITVGQLQV